MVPTTHSGRLSLSERVPVGLVGVITPWNFPLVLGLGGNRQLLFSQFSGLFSC
jgi:acyl-CoA reductase-like NAD-dependent aldehyde dehydrogenase